MSDQPTFQLSRLREIAWEHWDPIGLRGAEGAPDDEYDSYLLQAAGRLWNGESRAEVADYLANIETQQMVTGDAHDSHQRAVDAVEALNRYVAELRR